MKRILLKLSGEALKNGKETEIYDSEYVDRVAEAIKRAGDDGTEIALVVGARNIWRGRSSGEMDRQTGDHMGMLATVINSLCMKDALIRQGAEAVVMTATPMAPFAEGYSAEKAKAALSEGKIVIFGAGLAIPFLSTDTAGVVRAAEIAADAMFMAKNVDYIYSDDPKKNPNAEKFETIKASEILARNLKAIDSTAAAFCMSNGLPIHVFGFTAPDDIVKALRGEKVGTVITAD